MQFSKLFDVNTDNVVWQNPAPYSSRYFRFEKENTTTRNCIKTLPKRSVVYMNSDSTI